MNTWIKIVARNYYLLQSSVYQKRGGIKLGKLHWGLKNDLAIKCNTSLTHIFVNTSIDNEQTNLTDYLDKINNEVVDALENAITIIKDDLLVNPGYSLEEAKRLYKKFSRDTVLMIMGYYWTATIGKHIEQHIGSDMWEKIKYDVLHPHEKTMLAREYEAVRDAQEHYRQSKNQTFLEKIASDLADEFGFIHSEYRAQEWTRDDYVREITTTEYKKPDIHLSNVDNFDEYTQWLISLIQKVVYIFDEGKSAIVQTMWALRKTIQNLGFSETQVMMCTEKEFLQWTTSGVLPSDDALRQRENYYALLVENGELKEYLNEQEVENLIERLRIIEFDEIKEKVTEFKGQPAFRGVVTGRVKILFTQKDASEFKEGEVLVASMTTPELIAAMHKAAAFVTDEGGITCHAAIIARELKKPCIIGTKVATKVLKNGDKVEVDADKGIIKILGK